MPTIGINSFVTRQTAESRFSHFAGTLEGVAKLAELGFDAAKPGYRDGVVLVSVDPLGFFSGVVELTEETELVSIFAPRREGEKPVIQTTAKGGEKLPARYVELVLYRRDVLLEDGEPTTDADWELVSINARATEGEEPMTPDAMARNMANLEGGTAAAYTAEQFMESILYWSSRAMAGG